MRARIPLSALCALTLGVAGQSGQAATVSQSNTSSFLSGLATGAASAMGDPTTPDGGFGIVPAPGAVIFSDDFNYTTKAQATSAGWLFLTPNAAEIPELAANPDEFLFSGDTSSTGGTAPAPGIFRMRVSRPHDLTNTETSTTRQPVLAMYSTPITGDFIAETKVSVNYERFPTVQRHQGIFVTHPSGLLGGKAEDVAIDENSTYVAWGPSKDDFLNMLARLYPDGSRLINFQTQSFPGTDYTVRLVKRGIWYYGYIRTGDTGPWVLQSWFAAPSLAASSIDDPVIVGLFGKSWGSTTDTRPQYGDADFDYFRLNKVGATTGTFSNVLDGGSAGNWQSFSYSTHDMPGTKYQLRAGNTVSGGTLTDAGGFVGPDGTASTWFEDDAAQIIPNAQGKRYLEYKFDLNESAPNLPTYVDLVSAIFEPQGVQATYRSTKAEWGADAGGVQVQPGDGDLSLTRTQNYLDDFNTDESNGIGGDNPDGTFGTNPSSNGWYFYSGNANLPGSTVISGYSMTQRPGYFRMQVGYPQDLKEGGEDLGGVTLLRDIPSGVSDFEIETEVETPVQVSRQAGLIIWQDKDNFVGITVARRNENTFEVGVLEQTVLNNGAVNLSTLNYGSNTMQLRITKHGNVYTYAVRDAASPSPSWRVVSVRNAALTNESFSPTQVGLIGKSFGLANRDVVNYDFNYFKLSTLSNTGTKDLTYTLPAGSRADIVRALGDALSGTNTRFQVSSGGGFVGPDGTAGSFFSPNEPKLPAALASPATVRLTLNNDDSGLPYLHALGVQYATGDTVVARDTNAADFNAAVKDNVDATTTPGVVTNAGGVSFGDWVTDNLNFSSEDLTGTAWTWDTSHVNPSQPEGSRSNYKVTATPGRVQLIVGPNEDIGSGGRYHAFFRKNDPLTGDWEIETLIDTSVGGRENSRITGIGVYQDQNNMILLGLLNTGDLAQRSYNNGSYLRDGGQPAGTFDFPEFYLRIQKKGQIFTSWAKPLITGEPGEADTDPETDPSWTKVASRAYNGITNPQVGLMAMSVNAATVQWPVEYDYFRTRPLNAEGVLVSRVLDMGTGGNTPLLNVRGASLTGVTLQFRSAATQAGLASAPWTGPGGVPNTAYSAGNATVALDGLTNRYVQYRLVLPVTGSVNDVELISAAGAAPGGDAVTALRIAGGLQEANSADMSRLDVVGGASAGKIDLADAVQLLRTANGL